MLSASPCGLGKLIAVCELYATKSEMMVFGVRGKSVVVPTLKLDNSPLKMVSQFKYLGHMISSDLKDGADVERERRALAVRVCP